MKLRPHANLATHTATQMTDAEDDGTVDGQTANRTPDITAEDEQMLKKMEDAMETLRAQLEEEVKEMFGAQHEWLLLFKILP